MHFFNCAGWRGLKSPVVRLSGVNCRAHTLGHKCHSGPVSAPTRGRRPGSRWPGSPGDRLRGDVTSSHRSRPCRADRGWPPFLAVNCSAYYSSTGETSGLRTNQWRDDPGPLPRVNAASGAGLASREALRRRAAPGRRSGPAARPPGARGPLGAGGGAAGRCLCPRRALPPTCPRGRKSPSGPAARLC